MSKNNKYIWDQVKKTDPRFTKKVNKGFGEITICSVQKLYRKTGALDDEAPKKAMTDALTKAFSHLGVSADVFLGLHDSSKYVNDLKKEIEAKASIVNKDKVKLVGNN